MSVFVVAELSANHNNDFELACKTVRAAAKSGADAVKVQTFRPESLALDVDNEYFGPKEEGAWKGWRPWDLYQKASLPYDWHKPLKELAESLGLSFFSAPFDLEAVEFLESLGVERYKIASFEINDVPLIEKVAKTLKPMILSTGVATLKDIELALQTCRAVGNSDITLLKCTSEYPASIEDANLLMLKDFKERFGVKVGVSDHTHGSMIPVLSIGLGAVVIEKHFILDKSLGGLDSAFSMEPEAFSEMVKQVRQAEKAMGQVNYGVSEKDQARKRSLFATKKIKTGERFTFENVRSLRPNVGLAPCHLNDICGTQSPRDFNMGDPITLPSSSGKNN